VGSSGQVQQLTDCSAGIVHRVPASCQHAPFVSPLTTPTSLLSLLLVQEDHGSGPPSTRVACTIGPESNSVEALTSMLKTGMAVSGL
jgi:hypothetical protein